MAVPVGVEQRRHGAEVRGSRVGVLGAADDRHGQMAAVIASVSHAEYRSSDQARSSTSRSRAGSVALTQAGARAG